MELERMSSIFDSSRLTGVSSVRHPAHQLCHLFGLLLPFFDCAVEPVVNGRSAIQHRTIFPRWEISGEKTDDGVGFPDPVLAIGKTRRVAIRIDRQIVRLIPFAFFQINEGILRSASLNFR
ncbi:hypothetical protein [Paraburkholderia sp. GAS348]|uniref:hypothetical protein n=1 Tax=Paraburkholderia sp. GAS348 TaxID=3035132 RepID=UPI003D1EDA51